MADDRKPKIVTPALRYLTNKLNITSNWHSTASVEQSNWRSCMCDNSYIIIYMYIILNVGFHALISLQTRKMWWRRCLFCASWWRIHSWRRSFRGYYLHHNLITAILSCKNLAYFLKLSSNMHTLAHVCVWHCVCTCIYYQYVWFGLIHYSAFSAAKAM